MQNGFSKYRPCLCRSSALIRPNKTPSKLTSNGSSSYVETGKLQRPTPQNRFDQMPFATQSIADDIHSSLSGIYNVINRLQSKLPMTSYIQAFLSVVDTKMNRSTTTPGYAAVALELCRSACRIWVNYRRAIIVRPAMACWISFQSDGSKASNDQAVGERSRAGGTGCGDGGVITTLDNETVRSLRRACDRYARQIAETGEAPLMDLSTRYAAASLPAFSTVSLCRQLGQVRSVWPCGSTRCSTATLQRPVFSSMGVSPKSGR